MSWSAVDALDGRMDSILGRWRGNPVADTLAYGASALGDHGLAWFLIGVARGRKPGPGRGRAAWAVVFSGAVTPVVNEALKRSVGRGRPTPDDDDPRPVRVPRSTSFPSGHALAAWCAATLLATDDPLGPLYYALAGMVSVSRVHLRQHHPTDVLAGAALGVGLGRLGRSVEPARFRARAGSGMGVGTGGLESP
jgi:membrane-associated phospholipid phosphatase